MLKKDLARTAPNGIKLRHSLAMTGRLGSVILAVREDPRDECRRLVGEMRAHPCQPPGDRARRFRPSLVRRLGGAGATNCRASARAAWLPSRRSRRHRDDELPG